MAKTVIGKWNGCSVIFHAGDKPKWTVERDDEVVNTFDTADDFGHWVFHSGFVPDDAGPDIQVNKSIRLVLSSAPFEIDQLRNMTLLKATGLTAVKKVVHDKKGTHVQTYWERVGEEVKDREQLLSLKDATEEKIAQWKRKPDEVFFKLVKPITASLYGKLNLKSVGVTFEDAELEGQLKAHEKLMQYKPNKGGGASLSTLIFGAVRQKLMNMFTSESRHIKKESVDRFDTIQNIATVADDTFKVEINHAITQIKSDIAKVPNIDTKDYVDMFNEFLTGHSLAEMAEKRGISRVMVSGKFKRVIYPIVRSKGMEPYQLSKEAEAHQKFKGVGAMKKLSSKDVMAVPQKNIKKSDDVGSRGFALIYDRMARMIDEKSEIDLNTSHIEGLKAKMKLDVLRKYAGNIETGKASKALYRYLANIDSFTPDFINVVAMYDIEIDQEEGQNGFDIDGDVITVHDTGSLKEMQYNLIMALISAFVSNLDYADISFKTIDPKLVSAFYEKFRKEFGFNISSDEEHAFAVFNTFVKFLHAQDYQDPTIDRYLDVKMKPDTRFGYVYHRVLE